MAVLTIHHWDGVRERGVRELRRVARGPVVIVTFDAADSATMWLVTDYLPEIAERDRRIFPTMAELAGWLGPGTRAESFPISRDTPDWTMASLWAHPERVLDDDVTNATSGFARLDPERRRAAVDAVRHDLADGTWDVRHGHLRDLDAYDAGMRVVVHDPR